MQLTESDWKTLEAMCQPRFQIFDLSKITWEEIEEGTMLSTGDDPISIKELGLLPPHLIHNAISSPEFVNPDHGEVFQTILHFFDGNESLTDALMSFGIVPEIITEFTIRRYGLVYLCVRKGKKVYRFENGERTSAEMRKIHLKVTHITFLRLFDPVETPD